VLVIDNGSQAGSVDEIRAACPGAPILENRSNLGYAGGNNAGLRWALEQGAEFALILNNDLTIDPPALRRLIDVAHAHPEAAILGPRVYRHNEPQQLFYSGWRIDWRRWLFHRVDPETPPPPPDPATPPHEADAVDVDWVQGCALLVRSEFLREQGFFDERYHLYCEDADLCVRAQRSGWRTVEVPGALVWHKGYGSSGRQAPLKTYYGLRNRLLFIAEHAPRRTRLSLRLRLLVFDAGGQAVNAVRGLARRGERRDALARLRALACALRDWALGRFGAGPAWLFRR